MILQYHFTPHCLQIANPVDYSNGPQKVSKISYTETIKL